MTRNTLIFGITYNLTDGSSFVSAEFFEEESEARKVAAVKQARLAAHGAEMLGFKSIGVVSRILVRKTEPGVDL